MVSFLITLLALPVLSLFLIPKFRNFFSKTRHPLPPGPPGLPIIGNLHHLDNSDLSGHLWHLSKRYGPLMSLRLGGIQTLVVSSAEMAEQVLKTNDLIFCNRPLLTGQKKLSYGNQDIVFSPCNEYWKQMRKVSTLHLFSTKQVTLFCLVREEEVFDMMNTIKTQVSTNNNVVNLSETAMIITLNIISREGFGKKQHEPTRLLELMLETQGVLINFFYRDYFPFMGWFDNLNGSIARLEKNFKDMDEFCQQLIDEHLSIKSNDNMQDDIIDIMLKLKQQSDSSLSLSFDQMKGVLMNILIGGTETSASTVVWAMTMLIKNPKLMKKAQQEVRNVVGNRGKVHEDDLNKLDYLKSVIKETFRLFPSVPLLIPHESRERCVLGGYEIPKKTLVYVNAWAIGRDPKCWNRAEEFEPERFMGSSIDYKGMDFELIPFGSGRRSCPGMGLGSRNVELILSNLLYSFDWETPQGTKCIDLEKTPGVVIHKKNELRLVARVHDHGC